MKTLWILCALLLLAIGPSWAATYTMGYPPPGGVTLSQSGPGSGAANGQTFSYTGFNSTQYHTLYWGLNFVANVNEGTPDGNMQFQKLQRNHRYRRLDFDRELDLHLPDQWWLL